MTAEIKKFALKIAKKEYACHYCSRPIEVGEEMYLVRIEDTENPSDDAGWRSAPYHPSCYDTWENMMLQGGAFGK